MPQNEQSAFVQAISTNKGQSATLSEKQDCGVYRNRIASLHMYFSKRGMKAWVIYK